jgi:IS6 family transposase
MTEPGLIVDHTTVWRWCQTYGPVVYQRLKGNVKYKTTTWHMDETYVRVGGRWMYLFRAVDSHSDTVDFYLSETRDRQAAKTFLQKALPTRTIDLHGRCVWMEAGSTPRQFASCKPKES